MKDLIIRISGTVQEQNLKEFEESALSILDAINLDLVTDEDFAAADKAAKDCKTVETRIANAKNKAMHDQKDISDLFTLLDKLSDKFRDVRLDLEKKVDKEKKQRKSQIVQEFEKRTAATASQLTCLKYFSLGIPNYDARIKGKRSLVEMRKACDEAYIEALEMIGDAVIRWDANMTAISGSEVEFPSLFPDRATLATKPTEEVSLTIGARISQHRLAMKEKEERERKAKEEREEAARKAREEAERQTEADRIVTTIASEIEVDIPPAPEFIPPPADIIFEAPNFDAPVFDVPAPEPLEYRLIVTVRNNDIVAALQSIRSLPEVISARED